jgi:alpha-glucosidase (family GH31 glycosyl hydrolase)
MATPAGSPTLPWDGTLPKYASEVNHLETDAAIEMRSGGMVVSIQRSPWRIQVFSLDGRTLLNEPEEAPSPSLTETNYGTLGFEADGRWFHALELTSSQLTDSGAIVTAQTTDPLQRQLIVQVRFLAPGIVRISSRPSQPVGVTRMAVAVATGADEHFFGFGEQFSSVDQRGRTVVISPEDRVSVQEQGTYKPVPFFTSSRGYGLLIESFARPVMEMASVRSDAYAAIVDEPALQFVVMDGPRPLEVLSRFADLTGHWPLPPKWAFGVWKTAIGGQEEVLQEARALRQQEVPVTAIWTYDVSDDRLNLGWPWPHHLAVQPGRYADPRAMNDQLHDLGYKVLGYLHPNLRNLGQHSGSDFSAAFRQLLGGHDVSFAAPDDLLIKHPDGSPYVNSLRSSSLDLSDPRAIDWWRSAVQSVLRDYDFDGWMQDFGEQAPEDGVYASGLPGVAEHNRYPVRYAQATFEAAVAVKPDFVSFARSASVGSTPYLRLTWTGDQSVDWSRSNGLAAQIPAMLSGAMSGIPNYAPDVAGYYDPDGGPLDLQAEKELWMRWVELGALSPTFRDMLGARHTQNVNLWTDAETQEHFRTYARLHNSLVPYIYSVARQASERGYPIMRHLFLEYPDDPNTYSLDDEYLLGDALLVCPVITPGVRDRSCYLPAGDWVDYWTGEMYRGAGYVTLPAPLERIPLLVRAGALLPTAVPAVETLASAGTPGDDLVVRITPQPTVLVP